MTDTARYDRAYFDRWYRHPARRVRSPAALAREVACVIGVTEQLIGRPVRSVLDVGCGEGQWYPALERIRPSIRYTGVDPSAYAVRRFGARRHIQLGTVGALDTLGLRGPYDLVVCAGVLNYVTPSELRRGLTHIAALLGGVAYLELYTSDDAVTGDTRPAVRRAPNWYRRAARRAGLVPCGLHCYVGVERAGTLAALERAD
ncbi:MAG TPA: class I SAM-dependent methyltransferase [Gemmatimonadaceae bacterium]|jgi:SAM-dependent methyltransferase|nr:class I SAM-dependent methyltransferase [Gemmatimonadaceae bacterium]